MAKVNGLDQLESRAEKRRRQIPTPLHPRDPAPVREIHTPEVVAPASTPIEQNGKETVGIPTGPTKPSSKVQAQISRLRAAQFHIDDATDEDLRRIRAEGLMQNIDVTNSAVVRRAVAELVERYGHAGIVALLADEPPQERRRGRPRR